MKNFSNPYYQQENELIDTSLTFNMLPPESDTNIEDNDDYPQDIIEALLPPQINQAKVSKAAEKFKNDTLFLRKFYFNPTFNNVSLLVFFILVILWIIVANCVTIVALWRTRRPGHVAEIYLANLAFSDVLLGILILPLMSVVILIGYFPFSSFVCDLWVFLDYYLIVASSFGSTALMVNYFWMICCPETFPVDFKHHIVALIVTWLAVNLSWTPPFFNDRLSVIYPTGQCGFSISNNQYFSFYIGVTGLYLPLLISLICGIWSAAILRQKSGLSLFFWRTRGNYYTKNELLTRTNKHNWKTTKSSHVHFHPSYIPRSRKKNGNKDSELPKPSTVRRLSLMVRNSFSNSVNDADEIARVAAEHFPAVASCLVLSILCRGLFFVYFGIGSFVHKFFPPDLSNGVYWLMHSEAALSPIVHCCFDSKLRQEILKILGLRNPRNSPLVQPIVISKNNDNLTITTSTSSSSSSSTTKDNGSLVPSISTVNEKKRSLQHFMSFDHDRLDQHNNHHYHNHNQLDRINQSPEGGLHL